MKKKRILGLIDAENIWYTPKVLWGPDAKVDFKKLYRKIAPTKKHKSRVYAYIVTDPRLDQEFYIQCLRKIGMIPKIKEIRFTENGYINTNWDEKIIEDGLKSINKVDELVLVSGDGDFEPLVSAYRDKGKSVKVICFKNDFSPSLQIADDVCFLDKRILLPSFERAFRRLYGVSCNELSL